MCSDIFLGRDSSVQSFGWECSFRDSWVENLFRYFWVMISLQLFFGKYFLLRIFDLSESESESESVWKIQIQMSESEFVWKIQIQIHLWKKYIYIWIWICLKNSDSDVWIWIWMSESECVWIWFFHPQNMKITFSKKTWREIATKKTWKNLYQKISKEVFPAKRLGRGISTQKMSEHILNKTSLTTTCI